MKLNRIVRFAMLVVAGILIAGTPAIRPVCPSVCAADQNIETLNNASVIEMQSLNLGDGVILDKIKTSKCDFDVTLPGLKQLKEAKVSDAVIQAMIGAKAPAKMTVASAQNDVKPAVTGDQNDPTVQHDSGVWLFEETGGVKKMTPLGAESYRIWSGMNGPWSSAERAVLTG